MPNLVYCVPTLEDVTLLKDPSHIISYQLLKFVTFPKSASMTHIDNVVSAADIISKNSNSPDTVEHNIKEELTKLFFAIFNGKYDITVEVKMQITEENKLNNSTININVVLLDTITTKTYYGLKSFYVDNKLELTQIVE